MSCWKEGKYSYFKFFNLTTGSSSSLEWTVARDFCTNQTMVEGFTGGQLAILKDEDDWKLVKEMMKRNPIMNSTGSFSNDYKYAVTGLYLNQTMIAPNMFPQDSFLWSDGTKFDISTSSLDFYISLSNAPKIVFPWTIGFSSSVTQPVVSFYASTQWFAICQIPSMF
jgi:hypothetical protein